MQTWWRGADELDEDQQAIMELSSEGSYAISGPPGSGKTNLLLMRAAYLSSLSQNIAILVMNRTLVEFIKTGAGGYGFSSDAIMTSRQFIAQLAAEQGVILNPDFDWEEGREEAKNALAQIVHAKGRPIYDAILIDEAQDHTEEELSLFRRLAHDLFLSADARQLIYKIGSKGDQFDAIVDEQKLLRYHYRSAPEICDLADAIGDCFSAPYVRIAPTSRYPASSPKGEITVKQASVEEQGRLIAERLHLQLRAFRGELIGVITPNRNEAKLIAEILAENGLADLLTIQVGQAYMQMRSERPICVSTVHGAKGLEFRAVHFAAAETVKSHGQSQKRLAFTAVTRAKTALAIYHDKAMPAYLNSAVAGWRDGGLPTNTGWRDLFDAR